MEVPFKKARIFQTSFLLYFVGFLASLLPELNLTLLSINLILATLGSTLFFILWKIHRANSKRYFSLMSYVMFHGLAIYFLVPIFRVVFGTVFFWIALVFLLAIIIFPYFFAESFAVGLNTNTKPRIKKAYTIISSLIIGLGSALYTGTRYSSDPNALTISLFLFLAAAVFLIISPMMLISPKRMEALERAAEEESL